MTKITRYGQVGEEWLSWEEDMTQEEENEHIKSQIQEIDAQLPILMTQRDGLKELIELGINASGDIELLEKVTVGLLTLANQRKELYKQISGDEL